MSIILRLCFILSCFCTTLSFAQYLPKPKNINQKDDKGKQGHWIFYGVNRPESHFPDSTKVEEGDYVDDRKEGHWVKYSLDGSVKLEGEYKNNRPKTDCSYRKDETSPIPNIVTFCGSQKIILMHKLANFFPILEFGNNNNRFIIGCMNLSMTFDDSLTQAELNEHFKVLDHSIKTPAASNVRITVFLKNTFYTGDPMEFGSDSITYHSAFPVVISNLSTDTLQIGTAGDVSLNLEYFEKDVWKRVETNYKDLPFESNPILLFGNESVVVSCPFFREKRKLRFVIGDAISDEFYFENN